jgi:hypothetical protein
MRWLLAHPLALVAAALVLTPPLPALHCAEGKGSSRCRPAGYDRQPHRDRTLKGLLFGFAGDLGGVYASYVVARSVARDHSELC